MTIRIPGFKVSHLPGQRIKVACTADCFTLGGPRGDEVRRVHFNAPSIPEARAWVQKHNHGMTRREARAESARRVAARIATKLGLQ